jgi:hypothetical protein
MNKLVTFFAFGAVLAAGLPGQAMAVDVVTLQCAIFSTTTTQPVSSIQASRGVTLPSSCAPGTLLCAQCVADLLSTGFNLGRTFDSIDSQTVYAGPYFLFAR